MANPEKTAAVAELATSFRDSNGAVLTDYRGLTVKQLQELRRTLGDNVSYAVAKNTLTKICLLYTSDAADDLLCVDPGGRRIIKKKIFTLCKGHISSLTIPY